MQHLYRTTTGEVIELTTAFVAAASETNTLTEDTEHSTPAKTYWKKTK